MRSLVRIANWPLAWKVPLLAAGLMIGVAVLISQFVLSRLASDQESNLRLLTSAYLDGLSAAVLPAAQRADVWEAFDALDRARSHYTGVNVRFAILERPNGTVLAASDPLTFPVQSAVPVGSRQAFRGARWSCHRQQVRPRVAVANAQSGRLLDWPHSCGNRHFRIASRAPPSAADLGGGQRRAGPRIRRGRLSCPQANARTAERIQRIRGTRSGGARRPHTGVEAARALPRV